MTPVIDELRRALDRTAEVVAAVQPEQLGLPTPCPDYDVRGLINHLVAGNLMFAAVANGDELDLGVFDQDHLEDDPAAAYRRSAQTTLAGWQRPGALDENLAFGNMPGDTVIRLHLTEELAHGWDLARATGQDDTMDPRLAEIALEAMRKVPTELLRSGQNFGAEVACGAGALPHERLVAFLGRDPAATPR